MSEQNYLIALILAEQHNQRIMPIGGKTIPIDDSSNEFPKNESEKIILDLLLRLFQRSYTANVKIYDEKIGILIAQISINNMQNNIPIIKSEWINKGNTSKLIENLNSICYNLWSINYVKYEGMLINSLKI
tara:strand:- start:18 stop:410 length:393 start_codon:yes stop_codon:yes gene_type:complete